MMLQYMSGQTYSVNDATIYVRFNLKNKIENANGECVKETTTRP